MNRQQMAAFEAAFDPLAPPFVSSLRKGRPIGPPVIGHAPAPRPVKAWLARRVIVALSWLQWQTQATDDALAVAHNQWVRRHARWDKQPIYDPDPRYRQPVTWGQTIFPRTMTLGDVPLGFDVDDRDVFL
jgi:hypothetical protein